jgi:uncharacterized protein YqhQ
MFCPKCNGEMGMRDVRCPHCGYDFAPRDKELAEKGGGFAYSAIAYVALALAIVGVMISLAFGVIFAVVLMFSSRYIHWTDWMQFALSMFSGFVLLIVLLRVFGMKPNR